MRVFVIRSGGKSPENLDPHWCSFFDDVFARRVVSHLRNDQALCTGCGAGCVHCRDGYGLDFSGDIAGEYQLPFMLPYYIDDPAAYLPPSLPRHDVALAINVHEDILLALPSLAQKAGAKAMVVPVEDPDWVTRWVIDKMITECRRFGLECVFPKPFCSLEESRDHPYTNEFIRWFRIGKPKFDLKVEAGRIVSVTVVRSAPCGSTYYVAHGLQGAPIDAKIHMLASKFWHSYPCVASMKMDYELGDTILHKGGYNHLEALDEAIARAG